jgi:transcriptional regulator with XRE-family HTH domain
MKSRDLTQREFARMAKVTYPYVNRILTGKSFRPSLDMVEQFAKALGMQVADLIA